MEIAKQFGIEPTLLLAQIVNFLVILFVLNKFFYKPIVKTLEERKAKIAQSLQNADLIETKLQETEEKTSKAQQEAHEKAKIIIDEAKKEAQRISDEATEEARKTHQDAISTANAQIAAQKEEMKKSLEKETLGLVGEVVKKVLKRGLKTKEKQELTTLAASEIGKQIH